MLTNESYNVVLAMYELLEDDDEGEDEEEDVASGSSSYWLKWPIEEVLCM